MTAEAVPEVNAAVHLLAQRILHRARDRFGLARLRIRTGRIKREVEDYGDAVAMLPYDDERREALLVHQLRAPTFVAGGSACT